MGIFRVTQRRGKTHPYARCDLEKKEKKKLAFLLVFSINH